MGSLYIRSLDGIRAAAVMVVFAAHAGLGFVPGNFGVTVFFFLSGFLITTLMRIELERTGSVSLRNFYARRALRILPPFYLVLAAASALTAAGALAGPQLDPGAVAAQTVHLSNYWVIWHGWWDGRAPGTWIYWSLAVEEHFYLGFPLVYLALQRLTRDRGRQAAILLGLCAAVLAWRCVLVLLLHAPRDRTYIASDTRIDSILFGCALAVWGNPVLDRAWTRTRALLLGLLPAGLAVLLVTFLVRDQVFEETVRYSLQGLALYPLFVAAMKLPNAWPFAILNLRPVRFLGVISYSVYLLHPTVIWGVGVWSRWPRWTQGAAALALTLGIATAIHYGVERPCAKLRRRLSTAFSRPRSQAAAAAAESPAPVVARAS